MVKHSTLFHSTLGAALLSTLLLSASAHAGLLGGGGAAGGFGGGLNGAFTPRSLNIDGQAAGQAGRDGALLPKRDAVKDKAGDTVHSGKDTGQSGAAKASETKTTIVDGARDEAGVVREQAGTASGSATSTTAAGASASRDTASRSPQADGMAQAGGALSRTAPSTMQSTPAAPTAAAAPSSNNAAPTTNTASTGGGMAAATRRADASANGSGQVSRTDRSVNADASAQSSVQR